MNNYTIYDKTTGYIVGYDSGPDTLKLEPNLGALEGIYSRDNYRVINGKPIHRGQWDITRPSETRIGNLPRNTQVRWFGKQGDVVTVNDGEIEFDTLPGQTLMVSIYAPDKPIREVEIRP